MGWHACSRRVRTAWPAPACPPRDPTGGRRAPCCRPLPGSLPRASSPGLPKPLLCAAPHTKQLLLFWHFLKSAKYEFKNSGYTTAHLYCTARAVRTALSATMSELASRVPCDHGDLPPHSSLGKEPGSQLQGHRGGQASVSGMPLTVRGSDGLEIGASPPAWLGSAAPQGAQNASGGRGRTCRCSSRVRGRALPLPPVRPSHWASCPGGCMQAPGRGTPQPQVPAGTTAAPGPRRRTEHRGAPSHSPRACG